MNINHVIMLCVYGCYFCESCLCIWSESKGFQHCIAALMRWNLTALVTCHSESVHIVQQVDVAEYSHSQFSPLIRHSAGRLLLLGLRWSHPIVGRPLPLIIIWEEGCGVCRNICPWHHCSRKTVKLMKSKKHQCRVQINRKS